MAEEPTARDAQIDSLLAVVDRQARSQEGLTELVRALDGIRESQSVLEARQAKVDATAAAIVPRAEIQQQWSRNKLIIVLTIFAVLGVAGLSVFYAHQSAAALRTIQEQRIASLTTAEANCDHINALNKNQTDLLMAVTQDAASPLLRQQAAVTLSHAVDPSDCSMYARQIALLQKEVSK